MDARVGEHGLAELPHVQRVRGHLKGRLHLAAPAATSAHEHVSGWGRRERGGRRAACKDGSAQHGRMEFSTQIETVVTPLTTRGARGSLRAPNRHMVDVHRPTILSLPASPTQWKAPAPPKYGACKLPAHPNTPRSPPRRALLQCDSCAARSANSHSPATRRARKP